MHPWHQRGDTSVRLTVLSVTSCHARRCAGFTVDTGVKRTSLSASSGAHPCGLVPCRSHKFDCALKSTYIMIVPPSSSSISSRKSQLCSCGAGREMCAYIDENQGFASVIRFSVRMSCNSRALVNHLSKSREDTVLLKSLRTTITILPLLLPPCTVPSQDISPGHCARWERKGQTEKTMGR